jgi:hypothetical protein
LTKYEIAPFELTPAFEECWYSAGRHLDLRVRDSGASWLRAELPAFREHLSFALGNQLFFIQLIDVDNPRNGWWQPTRLSMAVEEANGIGCLLPMKLHEGAWKPVEPGWGLIDMNSRLPLIPAEKVTEERILMTAWEIHDVGVQVAREYLATNGWTVTSWQSDMEVNPSIFAGKDGQLSGFVVRNSNKGPDKGARPENAKQLAKQMHARGWGAKFIGLKVSGDDDLFDPRLQHLTRRIYRRTRLLFSPVEIEELDVNLQ